MQVFRRHLINDKLIAKWNVFYYSDKEGQTVNFEHAW